MTKLSISTFESLPPPPHLLFTTGYTQSLEQFLLLSFKVNAAQ